MPVRPDVLDVKELSRAVDAAVKVASKKHEVAAEAGLTFDPSILVGRYLKEAIETKTALAFATDVARSVGRGNEPAVFITNKGILCGFIPVDRFKSFGF